MTSRAYMRARRASLKAQGLCQWCGARPAKPGRNGPGCRCEACAVKAAKRSRANLSRIRPAWRKLGLCCLCGTRHAIQGQTRCAVCAERQDECKARRREVAA
jgi:hypothetical protein